MSNLFYCFILYNYKYAYLPINITLLWFIHVRKINVHNCLNFSLLNLLMGVELMDVKLLLLYLNLLELMNFRVASWQCQDIAILVLITIFFFLEELPLHSFPPFPSWYILHIPFLYFHHDKAWLLQSLPPFSSCLRYIKYCPR